jgi:hypothetical protein
MQSLVTKLRRFLVWDDGFSSVGYAIGWTLVAAAGYIAYRMLRNGLF